MAKFYSIVFLGVVVAVIGAVLAIPEDERNTIRLAVVPILAACGQELGITKEEVLAARQTKDLDALNPCFYACFFKKTGAINSEGLVDPVTAKAKHRKYVHGQEDLVKLDQIVDSCTAVNDLAVSDGAQGCERAKLLVRCLIDHKASITPFSS